MEVKMGVNESNKKSFKEMMKEEFGGELVLPDFQRDFVWNVEQQKSLAATFMARIPLTSLLLLKGKQKDFSYKRLCVTTRENNGFDNDDNSTCTFLLDGQQRLATLKNVFSDIYNDDDVNWDETFDKVDSKLRYRWFLNLRPKLSYGNEDDYGDVFGIENLSIPKSLDKLEPSDLLDYIEYKKIKKGDITKKKIKWWHPAYIKGKYSETPEVDSKNESAKESLLPLYLFYDDRKKGRLGGIKQIISKIAENRIEQLREAVENGSKNYDEIFTGELNKIFQADSEEAWKALQNNWIEAMNDIVDETIKQCIYYIELDSDEIGRAVTIFENMNASGTKLSVFDLIVARAAAGEKGDKSLINCIIENLYSGLVLSDALGNYGGEHIEIASDMRLIEDNKINNSFKKTFTSLLAIQKKIKETGVVKITADDIKQNYVLKLTSDEIQEYTDCVVDALKKAYAFLQYRCGIISIDQISYSLMVLPIATLFLDEKRWNEEKTIDRIECWYWASIFSGTYSANQNARCSEDVKKLFDFVVNDEMTYIDNRIKDIFNQKGYSDIDTLLGKTKEEDWSEAMHRGILSYILSLNPPDFQKGNVVKLNAWEAARKTVIKEQNKEFTIDLQDHHLIPICQEKDIKYKDSESKLRNDKKNILNSPLNRTYITAEANKRISKCKIDSYMEDVNSYSKEYHFIPGEDVLKKKKRGQYNNYYEKVLTERFKLIKNKMEIELGFLKH